MRHRVLLITACFNLLVAVIGAIAGHQWCVAANIFFAGVCFGASIYLR